MLNIWVEQPRGGRLDPEFEVVLPAFAHLAHVAPWRGKTAGQTDARRARILLAPRGSQRIACKCMKNW